MTSRDRFLGRYGPWAVVTGASEGIGREFARCLAGRGLNVVLVARRADLLSALAAELISTQGVRARALPADVSTEAGLEAVRGGTHDLEVGLFVAAAGFGTSGSFVRSSLDRELTMIDVNCRAVAALAHHFGGRFATAGRGALVLFSSIVAFQGVPGSANYAATKAFVQSLAEGLRAELRPRGVEVIASAPGPIHSGFAGRAGMKMGLAQDPIVVAQGTLEALGRMTTVRPGWLSKTLGWSLAPLPRWVRVRVMGVVMGGMVPA